jgi:uncharacterized cupredoxin-like copper-binding protein
MNLSKPLHACLIALASLSAFAHEEAAFPTKAASARREQRAWGIAGDPEAVKRTIEVVMSDDMRFTPSLIEVMQGEVVKIVAKNHGQVLHEIVLGTRKELDEHAALMQRFPNMEHDEPYMSHVKPAKTGEIVWNFNRVGDFEFACLVPGHYQAGMVGKIKVVRAKPAKDKP